MKKKREGKSLRRPAGPAKARARHAAQRGKMDWLLRAIDEELAARNRKLDDEIARRREARGQKGQPKRRREAKREAELYLWHFQPELKWWPSAHINELAAKQFRFDHDPWWNGSPWADGNDPLSNSAVVWELVRRHPDANVARRKVNLGVELHPLAEFLGRYACWPWPLLSNAQQDDFAHGKWELLPPQHGIGRPPTILNDFRLLRWLYARPPHDTDPQRVDKLARQCQERLQSGIKAALEAGQIIIAVDPRTSASQTANAVERTVEDWQISSRVSPHGKDHAGQWLDVIARFEKTELSRDPSKERRDDQLFARYRRVIAEWGLLTF